MDWKKTIKRFVFGEDEPEEGKVIVVTPHSEVKLEVKLRSNAEIARVIKILQEVSREVSNND